MYTAHVVAAVKNKYKPTVSVYRKCAKSKYHYLRCRRSARRPFRNNNGSEQTNPISFTKPREIRLGHYSVRFRQAAEFSGYRFPTRRTRILL